MVPRHSVFWEFLLYLFFFIFLRPFSPYWCSSARIFIMVLKQIIVGRSGPARALMTGDGPEGSGNDGTRWAGQDRTHRGLVNKGLALSVSSRMRWERRSGGSNGGPTGGKRKRGKHHRVCTLRGV